MPSQWHMIERLRAPLRHAAKLGLPSFLLLLDPWAVGFLWRWRR